MQPNLFQIATKELSQDSFITWLIKWADPSNAPLNPKLNRAAQCFVRLLLNQGSDYVITSVESGRQWEHIDIWAEVNGAETIIIEDKTGTGEHSNQLARYKKLAQDYYLPKGYNLHFIYLKTGNESLSNTKSVSDQGYRVIHRKDLLDCLQTIDVENDIFREFVTSLDYIEQETAAFTSVQAIHQSWRTSEGFFLRLQNELLPEWSDWGYVANASGGFLGFWYHWLSPTDFPEMYIQIENADSEIKLVVKVAGESITIDQLYRALPEIQKIGAKYGLTLEKPRRFRAGGTSTLAIVKGAFNDSIFSIDSFLATLRKLEKVIEEYAKI